MERSTARIKATPAARRAALEQGIVLEKISPTGNAGEIRLSDILAIKEVNATPLAQRMARSKGIGLETISGSGHNGKIFSSDLPVESELVTPIQKISEWKGDKRVALTTIQKITGRRMFQSHSEIPAVTIHTRANVSELLNVRDQLMEDSEQKITINDLILKATAIALEDHPKINSVLDGEDLIYRGEINLNMAVATKNGLMVPVIRNANHLSVKEISSAAANLVRMGKEGKITPDLLEGGTFTISNVGMFGITSFSPIINQPQAAILGVCCIEDDITLVDGKIEAIKKMGLSLSFDHRVMDGAEASMFLSSLRDILEEPSVLLA